MLLALLPALALADVPVGGASITTWNRGAVGGVEVGVVPCLGGTGMLVGPTSRVGGQGSYCQDRDAVLISGGPRWGITEDVAFTYVGAEVGAGAGYLSASDTDARLRAAFGYARPAVFVGLPVGAGAVEAGLYAQIPFALVESVAGEARPALLFPTMGVELAFLFGDFAHRKDRRPEGDSLAE